MPYFSRNYCKAVNLGSALVLLFILFLFALMTGCTTIQKVLQKRTTKTDSTVIHRIDSLAYHQKTVKEGHQLSVRFDTGCTNTFTINPSTGLIQASGGVTGVVFTGTKEGKETDSVRLQGETKTVLQKETVTITKEKVTKPKWGFLHGVAVGVVLTIAAIIAVKIFSPKLPFRL